MRPIFIQFQNATRVIPEAVGLFHEQPEGMVLVRYPDGREEHQAIGDLPAHWQEQLRGWTAFGERL